MNRMITCDGVIHAAGTRKVAVAEPSNEYPKTRFAPMFLTSWAAAMGETSAPHKYDFFNTISMLSSLVNSV